MRITRTLAQFRKDYDGSPLALEDFAEGATTVTDCEELRAAGDAFGEAETKLLELLEKYEVEIG